MNGQIVKYLEMVSNGNLLVNFLMHLVVFAALLVIFSVASGKLKRVIFQTTLSVLFLSVTVHAIVYGNPFHILTFGLLAVTAILQLAICRKDLEITKSKSTLVLAFIFIFIGVWYPEFVDRNLFMLLFVSPVGIVPCPTLLTGIGLMTLAAAGLSKTQYILTAMMGLIYGLIGVFAFKVYLDITLLVLALYSLYRILFGLKKSAGQSVQL